MSNRPRTFPVTGAQTQAERIGRAEAKISAIRRQNARAIQRGHASDPGSYSVAYNAADTERTPTRVTVAVPSDASQLRVYAEASIDETTAGGGLPKLDLWEDGVNIGRLLVLDEPFAEDGRLIATGVGGTFTVPGGSIFQTGGFGFAVPPWGQPRQFQATPGTHTYGIGTGIEEGSAVSGVYTFADLSLWVEVL